MTARIRQTLRRRRGATGFLAGVLLAVSVTGGGVALAAIPSKATGAFTGCVNKANGALRVIDAQAGKICTKKREKTITWSQGWQYRGAWAAGTRYKVNDVVVENGSSYVAKQKSMGKSPAANSAVWGVLATGGGVGVEGPQGPKGDTGTAGATGATGAKGDKGDAGATGATGATGPAGPVNISYVQDDFNVTAGSTAANGVACPSGKYVVGGGVRGFGFLGSHLQDPDVKILESAPYDNWSFLDPSVDPDSLVDDGWSVSVHNGNASGTVTLTTYAICVTATSVS